jgi:hypothetical protein
MSSKNCLKLEKNHQLFDVCKKLLNMAAIFTGAMPLKFPQANQLA